MSHRFPYIHSLVQLSLCLLIIPQVVRKGVEIRLPLRHEVLLVVWTPQKLLEACSVRHWVQEVHYLIWHSGSAELSETHNVTGKGQ